MTSAMLQATAPPAVGSKLPDFTLKVATAEGVADWKLSDHLGKGPLVFAFFPLAFTGVCTIEMCDFRDNLARFAGLNATVLGFSVDTAPSNKAFATAQGLPFGILSDPNREVVGKLWPAMPVPIAGVNGVAKRGAMVVNADGTVKWTSVSDDVKVWVGTEEVRKHLAQ
jgi:peroxiredoxin